MAEKSLNWDHPFMMGSVTLSSLVLVSNAALSIFYPAYSLAQLLPLVGSGIGIGFMLDKLFLEEDDYQKLFRLCGIENKDGQVPIVIKKKKSGNSTTLVIHLPEGISQKHFEQKQQELEQALNCKIEFGFNENLIMKLIRMNLSSEYLYKFEDQDEPLKIYFGETNSGKFILDLKKAPHVIIAGETDSGKSSGIDEITLSLLLSNHEVEMHLVDFQDVTLGKYEDCKRVKSFGKTAEELKAVLDKMGEINEERLKLFRSVKSKIFIDKLSKWNKHYPEKALPYIVVIVDEFAALAEKGNEELFDQFCTRVSMDRKVGIHYIASMQRPDVNVIAGRIKANMPTRISYRVTTEVDSKVILDTGGAEEIKVQGRCLLKYCGEIKEVQTQYIDPDHILGILKKNKCLKTHEEKELERKMKNEETTAKRKQQIEVWRKNHKNPY